MKSWVYFSDCYVSCIQYYLITGGGKRWKDLQGQAGLLGLVIVVDDRVTNFHSRFCQEQNIILLIHSNFKTGKQTGVELAWPSIRFNASGRFIATAENTKLFRSSQTTADGRWALTPFKLASSRGNHVYAECPDHLSESCSLIKKVWTTGLLEIATNFIAYQ